MDFSDRLRMISQGAVASAATPYFVGTWTSGATISFTGTPILGANVIATGIPSNTTIIAISGSTLTISNATTAAQTAIRVAMTPASSSLGPYASYDSKYTIENGLSNLTYGTDSLKQKDLPTNPISY